LRYVVGENVTDAQVSYTFAEGSRFKGLSLLLQASNLGDEAYRTYLCRHQGSSAGIHQVGPYPAAGCQLQVLITRQRVMCKA
jgi:hypothetical protein